MTALRVATYHRCSTVDQNPSLARAELQQAAARLGDLVMEIEEKGSGARNDRPGLQRVMEAARRDQVDAVAVWKLDRFGRSALDLLANIRALDTAGVRFVATSQGIDIRAGGDAMSRMTITMLAAVAEFERDLIRDRTRLGLAAARRRGIRLGRPVEPGPSAAEVRRRRVKGESWTAIADALDCTVAKARRLAAA
jgi:putative DNA-invertase from lambdoid prophage Rac